MAVFKTFNSSNYVGKDGRNLSVTLEEISHSNTGNYSDIRWTLSTSGGDVTYYDTFCLLKINGSQKYFSDGRFSAAGYSGWIGSENHPWDTMAWVDRSGETYTCAKWGFSTSGTVRVYHDANGKGSINVSFLVGCFYYTVRECGGSATVPTKIDRTPPVITQNKPENTRHDSCDISASANVACSNWWWRKKSYNTDTWESWSPVLHTSSAHITGLLPNHEYNFQWCGQKNSNGVYGYSESSYVKTLGASLLNSAKDIYVDIERPTLSINVTVYSTSFYHKLVLGKDSNELVFDLKQLAEGTSNLTLDLTAKDGNGVPYYSTLLDWIGSTSLEVTGITATLSTYLQSNLTDQVGESSTLTNTIRAIIRAENAQPTLTVGGYVDEHNWGTGQAPPKNTYIVPEVSEILVQNISATAKLRAYIKKITITSVGDEVTKTVVENAGTSLTQDYSWGTTSSPMASYMVVELTDSRDFKKQVPILLQIYRPGILVRTDDYNYWFNILSNHFFAQGRDNTYFISDTTNPEFNLPGPKERIETTVNNKKVNIKTDEVLAADLYSNTEGIIKHLNQLPVASSSDYYYDVSSNIDALKTIITSDVQEGKLIDAATKTEMDANFKTIDSVHLFSLVRSLGASTFLSSNYIVDTSTTTLVETLGVYVQQISHDLDTGQSVIRFSVCSRCSGGYYFDYINPFTVSALIVAPTAIPVFTNYTGYFNNTNAGTLYRYTSTDIVFTHTTVGTLGVRVTTSYRGQSQTINGTLKLYLYI